jgi:hypothetical protein
MNGPLEDQVAIGRNNAIKCYNVPLDLASFAAEMADTVVT